MSLYDELAKALSQPSRAYRTASAALQIPEQGLKGYKEGLDYVDGLDERKLKKQTLEEALGGNVPSRISQYRNLRVPTVKDLGGLKGLADITEEPKSSDWMIKFNMQQEAIGKRQKDRQDFIRSMIGEKGNKEAVNEALDASKAAEVMDSLNKDLDQKSEFKARASSSAFGKVFDPLVATKRAQIMSYAGFSRGGKNLTGNELAVVVDSTIPTMLDNPESRHEKNRIFQDWAQGKIGLLDMAKLLGPAGVPLMKIAQDQKLRQEKADNDMAVGLSGGSGDLDTIFGSLGGD